MSATSLAIKSAEKLTMEVSKVIIFKKIHCNTNNRLCSLTAKLNGISYLQFDIASVLVESESN